MVYILADDRLIRAFTNRDKERHIHSHRNLLTLSSVLQINLLCFAVKKLDFAKGL